MPAVYLGIFCVSATTLLLEITLTRIFSVTQGYHFAFMAVSLALLGFGASGTALAVWPRIAGRDIRVALAWFSAGLAVTSVGGLLATNALPFDAYTLVWRSQQLLYLTLYYLVLAVPFFFAGGVVGAALARFPERAGSLYGVNLVGAALGCLLSLWVPALLGASRAVVVVALLGLLATSCLVSARHRRALAPLALVGAVLVGMLAFPAVLELNISPYKGIAQALCAQGAEKVWSEWNSFSLVEVIDVPSLHMAPGLSFTYDGELPPQIAIAVDGDNLSPVTAMKPGEAEFTEFLPTSLAYQLSPDADALLIEPKGGLDLLTALHHDVDSVVAVLANPLVHEAAADRFGARAGRVYSDPRVEVELGGHRSFLRRTERLFDVVQVSLTDSFRPVLAGAYGISESYLYTTDAFQEYYRRLAPNGFLSVTRWIQVPPSEGTRVVSIAVDALRREGVEEPAAHIAVIRTLQTLTLLVKRTELTARDIDRIKGFSRRLQFDVVFYPGIGEGEPNRYNVHPTPVYHDAVTAILSDEERAGFYRRQRFDLSPVSDDRPFFFHLFKWSQTGEVLGDLGRTFQPFGGAGFLIIFGILAAATASAIVLIVLPLLLRRAADVTGRAESAESQGVVVPMRWPLVYFSALGVGFLWVEVPLLQQLILYLDQPTYSFAAVLFAVLFWSGVGSLLSDWTGCWSSLAVAAAGGLALVYAFAAPAMFDAALGLPLPARLAVAILSLAPLGIALGVPLPSGMKLLGRTAPRLVPWAWAVNGSVSVVSAILATVLALTFGFTWVIVAAAAAYLLAAVIFQVWSRSSPPAPGTPSS